MLLEDLLEEFVQTKCDLASSAKPLPCARRLCDPSGKAFCLHHPTQPGSCRVRPELPAACLEAPLQALATCVHVVCTLPSTQNTNLIMFPQTAVVFCVVLRNSLLRLFPHAHFF